MSLERIDTRTDPHWKDYVWGEKGNQYPIYFTGLLRGVEDHYDFDCALMAIAHKEGMADLVMTNSESGQIFIYAKNDDAADWMEATVRKITDRLAPTSLDKIVHNW